MAIYLVPHLLSLPLMRRSQQIRITLCWSKPHYHLQSQLSNLCPQGPLLKTTHPVVLLLQRTTMHTPQSTTLSASYTYVHCLFSTPTISISNYLYSTLSQLPNLHTPLRIGRSWSRLASWRACRRSWMVLTRKVIKMYSKRVERPGR